MFGKSIYSSYVENVPDKFLQLLNMNNMQVPLPVNSINPTINTNPINSNVQNPDDSSQINIVPEQNQEGIYEDFNLDLFLENSVEDQEIYEDFNLDLFLEDSAEDQEGIDAMEAVLQYDTGLHSQTISNFSYKTISLIMQR